MESLALLVSIIIAPAMFGGPIALLLSIFRRNNISAFRRNSIVVLALLSSLVGIYLIIGDISRGATLVGALGLATGLGSLVALKRNKRQTP